MDREEGMISSVATFLSRKGRRAWPLTVAEKIPLTPRMMRVRFTGTDLDELEWKRGQDFVLEIPQGDSFARRHYTIRNIDGQTLDIDFVLHGKSPVGDWVANAKAGDPLIGVGPRGHTYLREADWHLFIGDETGIPGIFAMLEGLPPTTLAYAFIEVGDEADKIAFDAPENVRLEWVSRGGVKAGPNKLMLNRLEQFQFPSGRGHAYVIGETSNVRAIRHRLLERGLAKDQIAAEGYWRPGRVGGHDHV
jgi:NADPH-dependent ferric siderophore reductase